MNRAGRTSYISCEGYNGYIARVEVKGRWREAKARRGTAYDAQGGGSVSAPRQYRGTTVGGRGRDGISQMANGKLRVLEEGTPGGANCGTGVSDGSV